MSRTAGIHCRLWRGWVAARGARTARRTDAADRHAWPYAEDDPGDLDGIDAVVRIRPA